MDLLLDSHVFLWFDLTPEKLSRTAYDSLINEENTLYISLVSIWEMQIKLQLGKLVLDDGLPETIKKHQMSNQLKILNIEANHIFTLASLSDHHRDPFDRMLIAQAKAENYTLVTADKNVHSYSDQIALLW